MIRYWYQACAKAAKTLFPVVPAATVGYHSARDSKKEVMSIDRIKGANGEIGLVTGANGFLGKAICRAFTEAGFDVRALVRNPGEQRTLHPIARGGIFRCDLPGGIDESAFDGNIRALIHCAYSTAAAPPDQVRRINIEGTETLLRLARKAGVRRIVFISSLSAHPAATSLYGRTKLELEGLFTTSADTVIKPATIIGPGGVFAHTRQMLRRLPVVPLFYADRKLQTIWIGDACAAILAAVRGDLPGTFVLAHQQAIPLREFYRGIASLDGRQPFFLPFPGDLAVAILSTLEKTGVSLPIHADNLLGIRNLRWFDPSRDMTALGISPLSFEESLKRMER
jgi:NADH dehydrogenase